MTDKQPEALRLANELGGYVYDDRREWSDSEYVDNLPNNYIRDAAAELRRLHEVNAELVEALREMVEWYAARDADSKILPALNQNPEIYEAMQVLAKATGEQQ